MSFFETKYRVKKVRGLVVDYKYIIELRFWWLPFWFEGDFYLSKAEAMAAIKNRKFTPMYFYPEDEA